MDIIAHRGASSLAPENTLLAVQIALDFNADYIEIDCRRTRDNRIVVFHDETLARLLQKENLPIAKVTYDDLRTFDLGQNQKVPLLEEVAELIGDRSRLMIETKSVGCADQAVSILKKFAVSKKLSVTSSFIPELIAARQHFSDLPVSLVINNYPVNFEEIARYYNIHEFSIERRFITKQRAQTLKNKGYIIRVFTVNDLSSASVYEDWGVDAVFTDYPQLFSEPQAVPEHIRRKYIPAQ